MALSEEEAQLNVRIEKCLTAMRSVVRARGLVPKMAAVVHPIAPGVESSDGTPKPRKVCLMNVPFS